MTFKSKTKNAKRDSSARKTRKSRKRKAKASDLSAMKEFDLELKEFACPRCDQKFKTSNDLFRHMREAYECPTECHICDKKLKCMANVLSHSYVHKGIKPYKCPKCDYETRTRFNLRVHLGSCAKIQKFVYVRGGHSHKKRKLNNQTTTTNNNNINNIKYKNDDNDNRSIPIKRENSVKSDSSNNEDDAKSESVTFTTHNKMHIYPPTFVLPKTQLFIDPLFNLPDSGPIKHEKISSLSRSIQCVVRIPINNNTLPIFPII